MKNEKIINIENLTKIKATCSTNIIVMEQIMTSITMHDGVMRTAVKIYITKKKSQFNYVC